MEINWSTFVLEMLNFLVLIWILKHFFYKPVQDVITRRKAGVEKTLADAQALHAEAEQLHARYENRLSDWEKERQQALEGLSREIETERERRMEELYTSLEQEKKKNLVAEEHRRLDNIRETEEAALAQGARFAAYLLKESSGPETELRLIELVIEELGQLPPERISVLRSSYEKSRGEAVVSTAFSLSDELRQRFEQALENVFGPGVSLRFEQNSELLAGVLITINSWGLGANLRDELKGFAALAHGA